MGIGQAITMPLFFASNAIYPISLMPGWLKVVAAINPLSYIVDALRGLLLPGYPANFPLDAAVIVGATILLVTLAGWSFKRIVC